MKEGARGPGPVYLVRYAVGFVASALLALGFDLALRCWILPRHRKDDARKAAAMNRFVRLWGRSIFGVARTCLGIRLTVEGTPPATGRYLLISNHQSSLDIPMLIALFPSLNLKFVAMEELRYGTPAVSLALRHGGFALVSQERQGEDLAVLTEFANRLEHFDGSPVLFPEGWLTKDGSIGPFSLAGMECIRRIARLPVLPVTIDGLWNAPSIKEYYRLVRGQVTVRISKSVSFEEIEQDPRGAYMRIEELIRKNLEGMRGN